MSSNDPLDTPITETNEYLVAVKELGDCLEKNIGLLAQGRGYGFELAASEGAKAALMRAGAIRAANNLHTFKRPSSVARLRPRLSDRIAAWFGYSRTQAH
jgi:hypothetical protein